MIDPAFFILQVNKTKRLLSIFKQRDWAKLLVVTGSLLIFLLIAVGVYFFSLFNFKFLNQYPESSQPVIVYSLAVTAILTAVLILFSSIITSLGTFFQRDDNLLVFSLPLKTATIFESRLLDTIFLSSWPLFVFGLPFILGYGVAFRLDLFSVLLFLIGIFLLGLISSFLGILLALVISRSFGYLKSRLIWILMLVAIPFLGIGLIKLLLPAEILTSLGKLSLEEISVLVGRQTFLNEALPTTWLVNLVYFWQKSSQWGLVNLIRLLLLYSGLIGAFFLVRDRFYFKAVNKTAEGRFIAAPWDVTKENPRPFPYLLKGKMGVLTEKDWLVIFRSPAQIFQLGFILFLQFFYFLIIVRIPLQRFEESLFDWYKNRLVIVNFLMINYLVTVFAMRFFFPMISLEGQSSWVIWSAPIRRMKVFWQKFISSFLIIFVWLEAMIILSSQVLALPVGRQWPLILVNLPVALCLVAITLGIGTIKPNFWEKNPEKLSTSAGGIVATLICLVYLSLVAFFLASQNEGLSFLPVYGVIWLISGLTATPILFWVSHKIYQYEV